MRFEKGMRYLVVSDNSNFFRPGDVVISLETEPSCAYCCLESDYDRYKPLNLYLSCECSPLTYEEVVEFNSGTDTRTICEHLIMDKMRDIVKIAKMYDPTTDYLSVAFCNGTIAVNNDYWNEHEVIDRREVFEDDK